MLLWSVLYRLIRHASGALDVTDIIFVLLDMQMMSVYYSKTIYVVRSSSYCAYLAKYIHKPYIYIGSMQDYRLITQDLQWRLVCFF